MAALPDIVSHLDSLLRVREVPDDARAHNGLQVENSGTVTRVVAAVDACMATIDAAASQRGSLLLVHHGLLWGGVQPLTGAYGRRVARLYAGDVALYSAHLPLDVHPELGNNSLWAGILGLMNAEPFGDYQGVAIGLIGNIDMARTDIAAQVSKTTGYAPRVIAAGPARSRRVAVVTGAGASLLAAARSSGADTLITGEASHHSYFEAEESGINLILAGHYATETVGVQALAEHLAKRFAVPWQFVDHPTGL